MSCHDNLPWNSANRSSNNSALMSSVSFKYFFYYSLFTANLEVRNAHLPYGYSQTKEGGKSEAATSYNGINSELVPTTSTFGMLITMVLVNE